MHDPVSRLPSPGHLCGRPETPPCENVLQESPGHGRQSQKHSPRHYCKKINLFWTWKHGWVKILFGEYVCQLGWLLILIRLFTYLFHTSFRIIQKLKFKIQFFPEMEIEIGGGLKWTSTSGKQEKKVSSTSTPILIRKSSKSNSDPNPDPIFACKLNQTWFISLGKCFYFRQNETIHF